MRRTTSPSGSVHATSVPFSSTVTSVLPMHSARAIGAWCSPSQVASSSARLKTSALAPQQMIVYSSCGQSAVTARGSDGPTNTCFSRSWHAHTWNERPVEVVTNVSVPCCCTANGTPSVTSPTAR